MHTCEPSSFSLSKVHIFLLDIKAYRANDRGSLKRSVSFLLLIFFLVPQLGKSHANVLENMRSAYKKITSDTKTPSGIFLFHIFYNDKYAIRSIQISRALSRNPDFKNCNLKYGNTF
jgi:hypothetical protein